MTEFSIVDLPAQPAAACRATVPTAELKGFFDHALPSVWTAMQAQGVHAVGPPFARYHGMPGVEVDVEAGFPVAAAVEPAGEVRPTELPASRAAVAMHVGPYEGLADTWQALMAWCEEQGLHRAGEDCWEVYLSDPGQEPPDQWRTQLVQPVTA